MRRIYTLILFFHLLLPSHGQSIVFNNLPPKHEVRAVWLTTIGGIDWPHSYSQSARSAEKQRQELRNILDQLQKLQINTILLQTRIRGTMIYPSTLEPWDGCLSGFPGKNPGYDALKFAIEECHKRGMEIHAWVVTIPVGRWDALGCKTLRNKYPGLIRKIGAEGYMNPEDPRTGNILADICREITRKYDIDGIHLDYIRYPETWKIQVSRDKGRNYITQIVKKIHDAVKTEKPWVKMSCSPIGKHDDLSRYWSHGWNARTTVCQDAQAWLRNGLMDELFPMMYFRNEQFFPFAIDWKEESCGKIVVPGLGIYFLDPKEGKWTLKDVTTEMYHLRNIQLGQAFFRTKFLLDNHQGISDFTSQDFYQYPALVPPMTWVSSKKPQAPVQAAMTEHDGKLTLSWKNTAIYEDGSKMDSAYIYNNVYASDTYPVDISDTRNLIKIRHLGNSISIRQQANDSPLYFAITSMDKYGNESLATQSHTPYNSPVTPRLGTARMLKCDGARLALPSKENIIDANRVIIESLQGQLIVSKPYKDNIIDISDLNDGIYLVRSLNKKGISHPLGTFLKKNIKKL